MILFYLKKDIRYIESYQNLNVQVFNLAKKTRRICVVDTVYTLLLYYLICGMDEDDIFIMSGGIPKEIRKNIKHIYFPHFRYGDLPDSNLILIMLKRLQIIIKRVYGIVKLRVMLFFKTRNCNVEVYGHGHLHFSFPLYEYENSYLIEDGLGNYMDLTEPDYSQSRLLRFLGFYTKEYYEGFGTHKNIKKVYLTKTDVPEIIKNKSVIINIEILWKGLTHIEKNEILSIFNMNINKIKLKSETVLILTQPLSDEKFMTFKEEIAIYQNMIEKFQDKQIIIKPHPRDSKNYENIFQNIEIISKDFPIELLSLIGINPKVVCSITSTSLLNFKNSEIYVYEGELNNEQLNRGRTELIELIKRTN